MAAITVTRRGAAVVGICVLAVVMALAAGTRSLNAVVLPGVVALAAGYYRIASVEDPNVRRTRPADGFVGETREVTVAFHGESLGDPVSPAFPATVSDGLDDGVVGSPMPIATTVGSTARGGRDGGGDVSYRVRYRERGERRFGPVTVTATDVFGLFERRIVVDDVDTALAYPACHPIPAAFRRRLHADDAVGPSRRREEFDRLREYARGDPLRDVHWPSTAKHDEIVVKEFAAETTHSRVSIAGETVRDHVGDDRLATATASLALSLLTDGVPVDVTLPAGEVAAEPGRRGRRAVLELAARTGPGSVPVDDPDVRVVADGAGARYEIGDRTVAFDELVERAAGAPATYPTEAPAGDGSREGAVTVADGGEAAPPDPARSDSNGHTGVSRE